MKKGFTLFASISILLLLIAATVFGIIYTPINKPTNKREVLKKIHNEIETSIVDVLCKNELSNIQLSNIDISVINIFKLNAIENCGVAFISFKNKNCDVFNNQQYIKHRHHKNKLLKKYIDSKILPLKRQILITDVFEIRMVFKLDKKGANKFEVIPVSQPNFINVNNPLFTTLKTSNKIVNS